MDQSTDVLLTAAPSYQTSTFGDKYLSSTTPTLVNAGSRSPADAQLYHFTTTPSQTKDSTQTKVNIGLHYVASVNGKPGDSDSGGGDGIPDFVENWHGDGNYAVHTADETDWQHDLSDGTNPDKLNAVYDDRDLDGDGMVGSLERLLGKDPLVADNPLQFQPGGTASDLRDIPLRPAP